MEAKKPINYAARGINPHRLQALVKYAGNKVLDAGCGNGSYVLKLCDKLDIYGVDWQRFESWDAQPTRFSIGDVTSLALPPNSVDTISAFEVLEHLSDPLAVLRSFAVICRKNIIMTVPNCSITEGMMRSHVAYFHYTDPSHVNFFTLESISLLCQQAGFQLIRSELINEMNLLPFLEESFDLSGLTGRLMRGLLRRRQRRSYHLTSLIVAEKCC